MNYQKFIQELSNKYNNYDTDLITPKDSTFSSILNHIDGMTTTNILQLLNWAVECMEKDEIYCEIGTYKGSTLIGALINNHDKIAYAVDDFSEFDFEGKNLDQLENNLSYFNLEKQVNFCNQDFEEFFFDFREYQIEEKIGVYFYDGAHDYRSQLMGLLMVIPFLADKALIIVDDSNFISAQQANFDFLALQPHCELILNFPTPQNCYSTFWNGIQVFSWDKSQQNNHNWDDFSGKFRNLKFLQYLYDTFLKFENLPS